MYYFNKVVEKIVIREQMQEFIEKIEDVLLNRYLGEGVFITKDDLSLLA